MAIEQLRRNGTHSESGVVESVYLRLESHDHQLRRRAEAEHRLCFGDGGAEGRRESGQQVSSAGAVRGASCGESDGDGAYCAEQRSGICCHTNTLAAGAGNLAARREGEEERKAKRSIIV